MSKPYVVIKARGPAPGFLAKLTAGQRWVDCVVMTAEEWRHVVESTAFRPLKTQELAAWNGCEFLGETERGVWLRNVNWAEVQRHTRSAKKLAECVHVSFHAYEAMRSQYYPWWQKTEEQEGFDLVKPAAMLWAKSGAPRPAEMQLYQRELSQHNFADGPPENGSLIAKMMVRCDPNGMILNLTQAKSSS